MEIEKKKYEVSVILTLFNRRKYIKRAIDSVLEQTFKNFELIIIDDGSTDNVEKVIFPLVKEYKNFKYLRHSNRFTALSLNTGILVSTGKYITFLDSDDRYAKSHLTKRVNYFRKNKRVDFIHSTAEIIGTEDDMYVPDARNKKKLIHLNDCVIGGTFFGRRKVFEELDGFKDKYAYDFDFYNRAKKKRFKIEKLDTPTYIYHRDTNDSVINQMKKQDGR